ncbi:MAG: hypothetical protein KDJ14_02030 [Xanthomonadales bacterium]|nr:hypothetical protein [Xanthomonadales bacterium]
MKLATERHVAASDALPQGGGLAEARRCAPHHDHAATAVRILLSSSSRRCAAASRCGAQPIPISGSDSRIRHRGEPIGAG